MTKKLCIFDFDGTLVDSMPTFSSVMLKILDEFQIKYQPDIVKIITPLGYEGTAKYFRTLGIGLSVEELLKKINDLDTEKIREMNIDLESIRKNLSPQDIEKIKVLAGNNQTQIMSKINEILYNKK